MKMTQENLVNVIMKEVVGETPLSQIVEEMKNLNIVDCGKFNNGLTNLDALNIKSLGFINLYALIKKYNIDTEYQPKRILNILPKNTVKFTVENNSSRLKKIYCETLNIYEHESIFKTIECNKNIKVKKPWKLDTIDTSDVIIKTDNNNLYIMSVFGVNILDTTNLLSISIKTVSSIYNFRIEICSTITEEKIICKIIDKIMENKIYNKQLYTIKINTGASKLDEIITEKVKESLISKFNEMTQGL